MANSEVRSANESKDNRTVLAGLLIRIWINGADRCRQQVPATGRENKRTEGTVIPAQGGAWGGAAAGKPPAEPWERGFDRKKRVPQVRPGKKQVSIPGVGSLFKRIDSDPDSDSDPERKHTERQNSERWN
jgi:hypothetical protein